VVLPVASDYMILAPSPTTPGETVIVPLNAFSAEQAEDMHCELSMTYRIMDVFWPYREGSDDTSGIYYITFRYLNHTHLTVIPAGSKAQALHFMQSITENGTIHHIDTLAH
jgi:hypothetical protein